MRALADESLRPTRHLKMRGKLGVDIYDPATGAKAKSLPLGHASQLRLAGVHAQLAVLRNSSRIVLVRLRDGKQVLLPLGAGGACCKIVDSTQAGLVYAYNTPGANAPGTHRLRADGEAAGPLLKFPLIRRRGLGGRRDTPVPREVRYPRREALYESTQSPPTLATSGRRRVSLGVHPRTLAQVSVLGREQFPVPLGDDLDGTVDDFEGGLVVDRVRGA